MWVLPLVWATAARGHEPAPTGALQVEVIVEDTLAMQAWNRAVARIQRQWRRATRRSEDPIPEPELPVRGSSLSGVTVSLSPMGGEPLRTCVTQEQGLCLFDGLPPGMWRVVLTKADYRGVTVEQIQVLADTTTPLSVALTSSDDIIITSIVEPPRVSNQEEAKDVVAADAARARRGPSLYV